MIAINRIFIKAEVRKKMEEMVEKVHPSTKKEDLKAKVKEELSNGYLSIPLILYLLDLRGRVINITFSRNLKILKYENNHFNSTRR